MICLWFCFVFVFAKDHVLRKQGALVVSAQTPMNYSGEYVLEIMTNNWFSKKSHLPDLQTYLFPWANMPAIAGVG